MILIQIYNFKINILNTITVQKIWNSLSENNLYSQGAATMVLETGQHPGQLKDAVCSPGGTTIEAIHSLEKGNFRATLMNAVVSAATRSKELGS